MSFRVVQYIYLAINIMYFLQPICAAIDQYGIPVGKFDKGHWPNPKVMRPDPCAEDRFPDNNDPVIKKFPIFDIEHCNKHPAIPELNVWALSIKIFENAVLFIIICLFNPF